MQTMVGYMACGTAVFNTIFLDATNGLPLGSDGASSASNRAPTLEQRAEFGEHRFIGHVAAFAFPGGVLIEGARHVADDRVPRQ